MFSLKALENQQPLQDGATRTGTVRPDGLPVKWMFVTAFVSLLGYVCLFLLLFTRSLRESPTLVPDRWPELFRPLKQLLPEFWLTARASTPTGLYIAALYVAVMALLFGVYFLAVRRAFRSEGLSARDGRRSLTYIVATTAGFLALLLFSPAMFSTDLFSYISYGRAFAIYGDNPFFATPTDYA